VFRATRRRLAIWYAAVTAVLLLLLATGVFLYVRNTLIDRTDDTLHHVVEVVERSLVLEPVASLSEPQQWQVNIEASFRDNAETIEDDRIDLEWFSADKKLLRSTLHDSLEIPLTVDRAARTVYPVGSNGEDRFPLRQVSDRVEFNGQVLGYLRVSHPWFEVTKPTREFAIDLSIGIVAIVVSVAAIGSLLSEIAMRPVRESYQRLKQFTADASHELRSPVAAIQTNVQVALVDPELTSPTVRQQLQAVERLTRRLGKLVDDLLFLARYDSGATPESLQQLYLDEILLEVTQELEAIATEKNIDLQLSWDEPDDTDPDFTLWGDRDRLARLFTNVIANAIEYANVGGTVTVELQRDDRDLCVEVCDDGIGIPSAALPHIFDRFYRVDRSRSSQPSTGTGLGLAIAKAIADDRGGRIQIRSREGQGTTAIINLPINNEV